MLAISPGTWRHLRGSHLDRISYHVQHVFTRAVMSWLVQTNPRHRCILVHWHSIMLWEVSRVGRWAHYLSTTSEGPLVRGSGPIATSFSASEAKSNRCLPRGWVEKTSCLELLWNTLKRRGEMSDGERLRTVEAVRKDKKEIKNSTEQHRKCGKNFMRPLSCGLEGF